MTNRFLSHVRELACEQLRKKYGYSKAECDAYLKGYQDCASAKKSFTLKTDEVKEYYQITLDDDIIKDIVTGRGLKPLNPKK